MPLKWEVFHDQKLVHIIANGRVTLPEMEEHFDALAVADVLQYGKLFDATAADPIYTDQDVMAIGARRRRVCQAPSATSADLPLPDATASRTASAGDLSRACRPRPNFSSTSYCQGSGPPVDRHHRSG
jgi:hypothetical protein